MKKISLRTKCSLITTISLAVFALFSIVISNVFYNNATSMSSAGGAVSTRTQFLIIYTCAEIIIGMIIIILVMYLSDKYIVKPLVNLSDTVSNIALDGNKLEVKDLERVSDEIKNLEFKSGDEIEDVYRAVQKMQYELSELIISIQSSNWESEHDSMTMLSNKFRLDKRIKDVYLYADSIYVACLNVVNLHMINEQISSEAGDSIISKVARELRRLQSDTIHCYRLEEDNFLVIMIGYTEEDAVAILENWNGRIGRLNRVTDNFECRIALGGSFGTNDSDIHDIITRADAEMYCKKAIIKNDMVNFG